MEKNSHIIVKHNSLIEARYKLTLQEQKLVLNVAMMIKPDDVDFHDYYISVKDFLDLMEVQGENHAQIKQSANSLLKKPIVLDQEDGVLMCNWFSSVKYIDQAGIVRFRFDPDLKPYLLQLKNRFTAYKIENVMTMTSVFAIRLYELLKQYLTIGYRRFELNDLKLKMGVEDKYSQYDYFNKNVLVIAKREINDKSDIQIEYKPIKTGRKVTAIDFTMVSNPKKKKESARLPAPTPEEQQVIDQLPTQATPTIQKAVRKAVKTHGAIGAAEILENVKERVEAGKVENVSAYLTACFTEGHGVQTPDERTQRQNAEQRLRDQEQEQLETARKQKLDLQQYEEKQERMKHVMNLIEQLSRAQQDELKAEAEQKVLDENDGKEPLGFNLHVRLKMMELYPAW